MNGPVWPNTYLEDGLTALMDRLYADASVRNHKVSDWANDDAGMRMTCSVCKRIARINPSNHTFYSDLESICHVDEQPGILGRFGNWLWWLVSEKGRIGGDM